MRKSILMIIVLVIAGCGEPEAEIKLMTLAPGHFHAALIHKSMYLEVNPEVHVYAPDGPELRAYIKLVEQYNTRSENPTDWELEVHTESDFIDKMLTEKPGNVVVLAGNNQKKTEHIRESVAEGLNVLADKPMAINEDDFKILKEAFEIAEEQDVLIYDIMTGRYEIRNILRKEFSQLPDVFGELKQGTEEDPAIIMESVHHFFKQVSGNPLIRPLWYFDVEQQGEGIVDVTTHLVDMIQWTSFPEEIIDYENDIDLLSAGHWPTDLTPSQFHEVTGEKAYPDYLGKYIRKDSLLQVYANGEINYTLNGVHVKVVVEWKFEAPEGTGDTHYSIIRGSKANLVIRQEEEQGYEPTLYIEPSIEAGNDYELVLQKNLESIRGKYSGVELEKTENGWEVLIPEQYNVGHEAHFSKVTEKYLEYLNEGKLPEWEKTAMIAKYWLTTQALKMARETGR